MYKLFIGSMAQFKREAQVGRYVKGGYYGKHLEEPRKIIKVQSNGVRLEDGCFFEYPPASEVVFEEGVMKIYQERVKHEEEGIDAPANDSWVEWRLEEGSLKESELERYKVKIAQYELFK